MSTLTSDRAERVHERDTNVDDGGNLASAAMLHDNAAHRFYLQAL